MKAGDRVKTVYGDIGTILRKYPKDNDFELDWVIRVEQIHDSQLNLYNMWEEGFYESELIEIPK